MTLLWGKVLHSTFFSNPWLWLGASDSPLRKSTAQYFFLKSLTLTWREWLSSEEKYCTVLFSQIPDSGLGAVTLFKATVLHSTFFSKRRLRLGAVTLLWGKVLHSTFFSNPWLWLGAVTLFKSTVLNSTFFSNQWLWLGGVTLLWGKVLHSTFFSNPWLWLGASDSPLRKSIAQYFFLKSLTLTWRSDSPLRKSTAQYFFLKSLTLTWREWLSSEEKYCTVLFSQIPDSDLARVTLSSKPQYCTVLFSQNSDVWDLAQWLSSEEKYCTVLFSQIPDSDLARVTLLWGKVLHSTFFSNPWLWLGGVTLLWGKVLHSTFFSNPWLWLGASDSIQSHSTAQYFFLKPLTLTCREWLSSEEKYCTVLFSQIPDSDLARVTLFKATVLHSTFFSKQWRLRLGASDSPLRKSTAQYFFLKSLTLTWREWLSSEEKYCTVLFSQIPDSDLARVTLLWGKVLHSTFFSNPWLWLGASDSIQSHSTAQYFFLKTLTSKTWRSDSPLRKSTAQYFFLKSLTLTWREWLSSEEKYCTVLFSQIPDSDLARVTLLWGKVLHSTFFSNPWLWLGASDSPLRKSTAQYYFLKSLTLTWREWLYSKPQYCTVLFSQIPDSDLAEWLSSEEKYCTVLFSQIPDSDLARVTLLWGNVLHSTFFSNPWLWLGAVTLLWGKVLHSTFFSNPWLWLGASDSPLRKSIAQYFFLKSLTLTWRSDSPLRKSTAQYFFLKSLTLTWREWLYPQSHSTAQYFFLKPVTLTCREWLSSEEKYCTVLFSQIPDSDLARVTLFKATVLHSTFFSKRRLRLGASDSPLRKSTAQYFFLKSLTLTWREWLSSEETYCTVLFSQIPDSDLAQWLSSEEKYCTVLFSQIPDSGLGAVTLLWGKVLHSTFFSNPWLWLGGVTLLWGKVLHSTFFSNPWLWLGASDSIQSHSTAQYFFLKPLTLTCREWLSSEEKYCTVLFSQIRDSDLARVTLSSKPQYCTVLFSQNSDV